MIVDEWKGMYPSVWKGIITPESFSHPAKFSSRLIERIYQHGIECGWLHERSHIIDPFGGVGLGAWPALRYGMDWTGCELEPRFVALAQANIDAWNTKYSGRLARWGTARIIQGDSRHLAQVLASADGCISSPPYIDSPVEGTLGGRMGNGGPGDHWTNHVDHEQLNYSSSPENLGNLTPGDLAQVIGAAEACISSPPFTSSLPEGDTSSTFKAKYPDAQTGGDWGQSYGSTPGNLGNLPPGDVDACISSPPYADGAQHTGGEDTAPEHIQGGDLRYVDYGQTPGQLASLRPGAFEAAISSPPFEDTNNQGGETKGFHSYDANESYNRMKRDYFIPEGMQLSGDTFWSAAREIVAQVYQVLAPGAHAVWVTKRYIKDKKIVEFTEQWIALCESIGFKTLHIHRAMLIKHNGTSLTLEGEKIEHKTEYVSFFRRLAQKKGSPRIDWEDVTCMVK